MQEADALTPALCSRITLLVAPPKNMNATTQRETQPLFPLPPYSSVYRTPRPKVFIAAL